MYAAAVFVAMSDTNTGSGSDSPTTDEAADEVARINMRVPREKYEWLQRELDSFTSDTARFQYLIQFYSDQKAADTDGE